MKFAVAQHFILKCNFYINHRCDLLRIVDQVLQAKNINICHENKEKLVELLLYGHKDLHPRSNQIILKATINFISKSGRFSILE